MASGRTLLSAPWLVPIAWAIARNGLDAGAPGDSEPLPSGAELQLRRR